MTTVAVMQPTFLPWLGYFALIDRADAFVYLDDVQLSRQSWQTRNRLKGPDGPVMLSLPVARKPSQPMIRDARLADTPFADKLLATAQQLLARAPHADLAVGLLRDALAGAAGGLMALNVAVIEAVCAATGIATPRRFASDLGGTGGEKAARLVALTPGLGGDTYLSPQGAAAYLTDDAAFAEAGIALRFQNFAHPVYPQAHPPFLSHLSALDALAQVGPEGFLPLLRSGMRPDLTLTDLAGAGP